MMKRRTEDRIEDGIEDETEDQEETDIMVKWSRSLKCLRMQVTKQARFIPFVVSIFIF